MGRPISVGPWTREESARFLHRRTGIDDGETAARKIAQALGDLPLALEQAGGLVARAGISFEEYLRRFEGHWAELLRRGGEYPDAVTMSWELSLRQVTQENPSAIRLLNLLAFLSADGVAVDLLSRNLGDLPEDLSLTVADGLALDRAVAALSDHSLVTVRGVGDGRVLWLHRLVGALARERLPEDERRLWSGTAARLAGGAMTFDSSDASTWPTAGAALPHALAAARHAEMSGVPVEVTCGLLDNAGRYLNRFARYDQARPLLERALLLARRAHGDESPKVAAIANNLGRVLARIGETELARQHFEWALAIDQNTYGAADPHAATVMNNRAMALAAEGRADEASEQFEAALAIFEGHYGEQHPKVATLLNNLGCVQQAQGNDGAARASFERALSIAQATLGPTHPSVGQMWHNLAMSLRNLGGAGAAVEPLERALAVHLATFSAGHEAVVRDLRALVGIMRELHDPAAARRYEERLAAATEAKAAGLIDSNV